MEKSYDIIIIGGGLVGASLAVCLQNTPLRVALVETVPWEQTDLSPSYDDKVLALSYSSHRIFDAIGLWQQIAPYTVPIKDIHVSDQHQFGVTRLSHRTLEIPALGYVIRARHLGKILQNALSRTKTTVFSPAFPTQLTVHNTSAEIAIHLHEQVQMLNTHLLVAADGAQSKVRQYAGLNLKEHDYQQDALIANVTLQYHHQHIAYERFTVNGPMALLPLTNQDCSLIWTVKRVDTQRLLMLSEQDFLQAIQQQFGWRLGRFTRVGQRQAYPLHLLQVPEPICSRVVIIGNAAHTLHPIAGQGFNLGLRDVAHLAEVVSEVQQVGQDIGTLETLKQYVARQQPDQKRVTYLTDTLVNVFSNAFPPLVMARNLGLLLTDILPPVKKSLMLQMTGLKGHPSRLVRGLPLR